MNRKVLLLALLGKILRVLLTNAGTAISTFLVARHLVSAGDQLTIVNLFADGAPALIGMAPGAAWDVWLWLNRFQFVGKVEAALHLPITGKPSVSAVNAAQEAKIDSDMMLATATSVPPYVASTFDQLAAAPNAVQEIIVPAGASVERVTLPPSSATEENVTFPELPNSVLTK